MMKNKKLFWILLVVIIIGGISLFVYLSKPVDPPTLPELSESKIIVQQFAPSAILPEECTNKSYITETADYIIEGIIEKVESKGNEDKTSIFHYFTYSDMRIEKYLKGTPFRENKLQIVTPRIAAGSIHRLLKEEEQPIFHEGKRVRIYFQKTNEEFLIFCGEMGVEEIGPLEWEAIILYENGKQTILDSFQQPNLSSKMGNLLLQEIQKINIKAKCLFTERDIQEIKQKDSAIELIFKEPRDIHSERFEPLKNVKNALFILEDKRGRGLEGHILIGSERKERDKKCFWRIREEPQKILGFCEMSVGYEWNEQYGCRGINGCKFDPEIGPFRTLEECEFTCGKIWSCWAILKEGERDLDKSWIDRINSLLGRTPEKYVGRSTLGPCQTDNDCFISGCNSELCQSKTEEPLSSICIVPDKPTPKELNYECKCVNQKCQWSK